MSKSKFSFRRGKRKAVMPSDERAEEQIREREEIKLEKKDFLAMILSATLTIFLPSVLVLGAMCLLLLWIGGAL